MSISGLTGQKLSGTYLLKTPIAHGAHGVVYEAQNQFTGQRHAIKVFHPEVLDHRGMARLRRDADMTAALHHQGIVRIFEWSRRDVLPMVFAVSEFVDGESVQSRVRRHGRLPPVLALELGLRVSLTLSAAHKLGVVHRGLTPRNLLYAQPDPDALEQGETVKILDFGVAHLPGLPWLLHDTLPYRARELDEEGEADGRADQFALASILYEALTGRVPPLHDEIELEQESNLRPPPSLATLCPEAPPHLVLAVERAMSPMRADRFSSMADFARALEDRQMSSWSSSRSAASGVRASALSGMSPASRNSAASVASAGSVTPVPSRASSARSGTSAATPAASQRSSAISSGKVPVQGGPAPSGASASLQAGSAQSQRGAPRSAQSLRPVSGARSSESARPGSAHTLTPVVRNRDSASSHSQKKGKARSVVLGLSLAGSIVLYVGVNGRSDDGGAQSARSAPPAPSQSTPVLVPPPSAKTLQEQADLTEAEQALDQGDNLHAIQLAREVLPSPKAWALIATAACKMDDARLYQEALTHLAADERGRVEGTCSPP